MSMMRYGRSEEVHSTLVNGLGSVGNSTENTKTGSIVLFSVF